MRVTTAVEGSMRAKISPFRGRKRGGAGSRGERGRQRAIGRDRVHGGETES